MSANRHTPPYEDLNSFLAAIKEAGELIEINDEMSPKFEMSAVLEAIGRRGGQTARFKKVAGHAGWEVAGNVLGSRKRLARVLGVEEEDLHHTYMRRKSERISPVVVQQSPVFERSFGGSKVDLLADVPLLTHHERDAGPYLTTAVTFAREPGGIRVQSMGMHRIQVLSGQSLAICLGNPPLSTFLHNATEKGVPLEVAVVVGAEPAVTLASVTRCVEDSDKLGIAGGFRQKPVEVVSCRTVDLMIPASAQLVIEGVIQPGESAVEGPFGDSGGTYIEAKSPVVQITSVSHRGSPIYQALQPWSGEDESLFNLCMGSDILADVGLEFPLIKDLHFVPKAVCAHVIVSVSRCSAPLLRSAMVALLTRYPFVKNVTAVDEDVNIRNHEEVEWALATRFQADRDMLVLPGVGGWMLDPSVAADGSACKVALDATYDKKRASAFEKIRIPAASRRRAVEILDKILKRSSP